MLKAYMAYEGPDTRDGCLLVFANTRNQARYIFCGEWPPLGSGEYDYTHAVRRPGFDQYAKGEKPYVIWNNRDLPEGVTFYREGSDD
jgi:hypothetical protein